MTTENRIMNIWIFVRENRNINFSFVFYSDGGVQYASNKMTTMFYLNIKITQSMSIKGNCWNNTVAEFFFKNS